MNQIFVSNAPWIVGRPALFEYALEDFLGELGRQRPWTRARVQGLLEDLGVWLDLQHHVPMPLEQVNVKLIKGWLETVTLEDQMDARDALEAFAEYLVAWSWLETCTWLVLTEVQA